MANSADGSIVLNLKIDSDNIELESGLERAAEEAANALKDISEHLGNIDTKLDKINSDGGNGIKNSIADPAEEAASDLQSMGRGLDTVNSKWSVFLGTLMSSAVQSAFSALKDLGAGIIQTGVDFSSSMSRVQAISGATAEEFELLEDTARQLGAETVFSASDAAEALNYMALSGWDVQQSVEGIPGVLNLAAASGMGLAQASSLVTDNIAAFGLEAKDAAYFADMLAYAQSHSNTTAEQLGEAYRLSAANLSSAGQSVQTVTALLGAMADQGLKGSESGTALAAVMRDLTAKMEDGAIAIGDTSIEVMDANGNYHDLIDIMKDVESATDGMGDAQRATALANTFTADSIRGVNLILNRGVDYIADYRKELENATGTAETMSEVMTDNVAGDLDELSSAWEEFGLKLYEYAEEPMRDVIQWATNELIPALEDAIGWVAEHADTIVNVIQGIATALAAYTVGLGAYKAATLAAEIATKGFMTALNLSPITLAIGAIAALVGIFVTLKENAEDANDVMLNISEEGREANAALKELAETRKELNEAAQENVETAKAESQYNRDLLRELQDITYENGRVKEGYEERAETIINTLSETTGLEIEYVDGRIQKWGELQQSIEDVIVTMEAQATLEAYQESYQQALTGIVEAEKQLETAVSARAEAQKEADRIQRVLTEAEKMNAEGKDGILWANAQLGMSTDDARKKLEGLNQAIEQQDQVIAEAKTTIAGMETTVTNVNNLGAAVQEGVITDIEDSMVALQEGLLTAGTATEEELRQQLQDRKDYYGELRQLRAEGNAEITTDMLEQAQKAVDLSQQELDTLLEMQQQASDESVRIFRDEYGPKSEQVMQDNIAAQNAAADELDLSTPAEREGQEYVSALHSASYDAASESASMAAAVERNARVSLYSTGYNAAIGMGQGIYDGRSYVSSAAASIANSALSVANSILGIRSPSRVFAEVGKYIDQGLAGGIDDNTSLVTDTIADQLDDVIGMYDDLTIPAHFSASYSGIPDPPGIAMGTVLPTQIALQNARIGASSNALSAASGTSRSGNLVLRVYLSGKQIYEEIVKQDTKERISTGRSGLGNV